MKPAREMAERMKNMLVKDKIGVGDGFKCALNCDIRKLMDDYFDIEKLDIVVTLDDDGRYKIVCQATATKVKSFACTTDLIPNINN